MTRTLLAAFVLVACLPPSPPVAPVEGDPEATPSEACAALSRVGCPEAQPASTGESCPDVMRRMQRLRKVPLGCLAAAETVAQVQACGAVRCRE